MTKKLLVATLLSILLIVNSISCRKKSIQEEFEDAGLTFHDEQTACSACGETLEPDTFGKEGCYRTIDGVYKTKEQYARDNLHTPVDSHIPLPPESNLKSCPDCGETLEPGTFGKEGCYRTTSGYYLTKEQFHRLRLGLTTCDIDDHTAFALIGYDDTDLCGENFILYTFVYTDDYVHTEPLSEKITAEKVKEFAEDERIHQNDRYAGSNANIFAFYKLHKIYYDKQADMWLVDYYRPGTTTAVAYDYFQVFIDGNGVTREIYCPEENHTDDTSPDMNIKKSPVAEIGEFSYAEIHKTTDFIHKGEKQAVSRETLVSYADDELENSAFASYLKEQPVTKLAPVNENEDAFRVSYYWEHAPLPSIHVYINKNGETTDMYVHEW